MGDRRLDRGERAGDSRYSNCSGEGSTSGGWGHHHVGARGIRPPGRRWRSGIDGRLDPPPITDNAYPPPMALAHDWPSMTHVRQPVCRRTGCPQAAGGDGLCDEHAARQLALRKATRTLPPRTTPPAHSAALAALLAAVNLDGAAWRTQAACRGLTSTMFPESAEGRRPADYGPALAICATCPVVEPCRAAGTHEQYGVWGGTTSQQRRGRPQPISASPTPTQITNLAPTGPGRASEAI